MAEREATIMTDNTTETREQLASVARTQAGRAVVNVIQQTGGPLARDGDAPAGGLAAARAVELAARRLVCDYIRAAREAGQGWQEIGTALGLTAGGDGAGDTIAEAAFSYAAGPSDSHWNRTYGPSVIWRCPACSGLISDHGPVSGPRDDEPGHADGCERLAATLAAWDAQWNEED
jgi:hypothetical protein